MSTYTVTTNFTAKDSLPSSDDNKIIKGADFGTEFNNISTAVNDTQASVDTLETAVESLEASVTTLEAPTSIINIGDWAIAIDGNDLVFHYNEVDVLKVTTTGEVIAKSTLTSNGAP